MRRGLLTTGMLRAHSSPPNLQLICRAIFCETLRSFCDEEMVLAMMTWNEDQQNGLGTCTATLSTWDGIGFSIQQSFFTAEYLERGGGE